MGVGWGSRVPERCSECDRTLREPLPGTEQGPRASAEAGRETGHTGCRVAASGSSRPRPALCLVSRCPSPRGGGASPAETPDGFSGVFFWACREVFKAKHRQTGQKVALKKVLMENEKEGVSMSHWAGLPDCVGFHTPASKGFVLRFYLYLLFCDFPWNKEFGFPL